MTQTNLKGKSIRLAGHLPPLHTKAPDFVLVDKDLHDRTLAEFRGKKKILATVPSLDTATCNLMTKHLDALVKKHPELMVITISADLPFAQKRFCEAENVHNVLTLSMMRNQEFGKNYGVLIEEGVLAGLLARSVILLDEKDHVLYAELVSEITQEPDYHALGKALQR